MNIQEWSLWITMPFVLVVAGLNIKLIWDLWVCVLLAYKIEKLKGNNEL